MALASIVWAQFWIGRGSHITWDKTFPKKWLYDYFNGYTLSLMMMLCQWYVSVGWFTNANQFTSMRCSDKCPIWATFTRLCEQPYEKIILNTFDLTLACSVNEHTMSVKIVITWHSSRQYSLPYQPLLQQTGVILACKHWVSWDVDVRICCGSR